MMTRNGAIGAASVMLAALVAVGCGLDDVRIPELDGPSETGVGMRLSAEPDLITADGNSTSLITAQLFLPDGRPAAGRNVFFTIADEEGRFADIGDFPGQNGPGTGVTLTTNGNGVVQVVYRAPALTDVNANRRVLIAARVLGTDATAATYRTVAIELRAAEPRLFPQDPENDPPTCNFLVEAPSGFRTNVNILFQTTSFDADGTIVRYEWFFGDGSGGPQYTPDTNHTYRSPGSYTVTHQVTDNGGKFARCSTTLSIR